MPTARKSLVLGINSAPSPHAPTGSNGRTHAIMIGAALSILLPALMLSSPRVLADGFAAELPDGVRAVWETGKAYRETTPTRERICLNGLWRWQPADARIGTGARRELGITSRCPGAGRGSPTTCRRTPRRSTRIRAGRTQKLAGITAAWYQREITFPASGPAGEMSLGVEYLNSYAAVFVDGENGGRNPFPRRRGGPSQRRAARAPRTC